MSRVQPFSTSRTFDAPREIVFQAHVDPVHLRHWAGTAGAKVLKSDLDLRPGGVHHYGYETADGSRTWGRQIYREIAFPEKLVFLQGFSDETGAPARHPQAPAWPLEMLATTLFEEAGRGKTKLTATWTPHDSDAAGEAVFDGARAGMEQGFAGSFDRLDDYLAESGRELMHSRVVDAPRERVWKAFTDPGQVNSWWGPDGFRNTEVEQEVRVGGTWKFKMIGPDGKVYPNRTTYLEIQAPERLVYDHGTWEKVLFRAAVTLEEAAPDRTRVVMNLVCPSREIRDSLAGFALEGGHQTLAKLDAFLARPDEGGNHGL